MSRVLKYVLAAFAAAVVETSLLWVLSRVGALDLAIDIAVAYAGGFLTLVAALHILKAPVAALSLGAEVRIYALLGMASVLLAVTILSLCVHLLGLNLATTNIAALVAVAFWIALGWPFVGDRHWSASSGVFCEELESGRLEKT